MVEHLPSTDVEGNRKRKAHRKSRNGCQNCKIRRVKCDENVPCKKCEAYGVVCNSSAGNTLQPSLKGLFSVEALPAIGSIDEKAVSLMKIPLTQQPRVLPDSEMLRKFNSQDLDLIDKFHNRTVLTIGSASSVHLYRAHMMELAFEAPFLMHMILAFTLMHDRYLRDFDQHKQSTAEAFHWYKGTAAFNVVLAGPIAPAHRDALWATAALLGAIAFACIDATNPEEAWPLKPPSSTDLEWLRMTDGKKEIFRLADPFRPDSVFSDLGVTQHNDIKSITQGIVGSDILPEGFHEVFHFSLDPADNNNNPYYSPACVIARLLTMTCNHVTIIKFLGFIGHVHPNFKKLLVQKDPRALLLLSYWFGMVCSHKAWWIQRRARFEGQAICIYLARYYWHDQGIQKLLKFPRLNCGLDTVQYGTMLAAMPDSRTKEAFLEDI